MKASALASTKPVNPITPIIGLSLIAQYMDGSTVIEVASAHKLKVTQVGSFLKRAGVLNNRPRPKVKLSDRDFDIVNLAAIGIGANEIAKEFGITVAETKYIISTNKKREAP